MRMETIFIVCQFGYLVILLERKYFLLPAEGWEVYKRDACQLVS